MQGGHHGDRDHPHYSKVAYEGRCRGQGGEFILPPVAAAIEAEEEEEDCPDTCAFNYDPVCGTGTDQKYICIVFFPMHYFLLEPLLF